MKELKFKPEQTVICVNVKSASSIGYIGTRHKVYDYIKHPEFIKHSDDGEILYPCISDNGYFVWFYESELMTPSEVRNLPPRKPRRLL